ncbi:MAG: dethiobiotin synthase [Chthoniobacteraceae bacterium]|nr:dethiobiotin synthase [Chthoniobacteraceae bacterium]
MIGSLFLTGTDTDVGKTYVAALLIKALRERGVDAVGMKPICCGLRLDAEILHEACDAAIPLNEVNPVWLRTPAAPYTAALIENRPIDLALIRETYSRLRKRHSTLIVEGVGGWRVPITERYFVSDLAIEMGLPVAVVVANKLGALNHALLTVESVKASGLICAGIILNENSAVTCDLAASTNRSVLESLLDVPVLFEIKHGENGLIMAG